jgi:signal transduction histidine kinase
LRARRLGASTPSAPRRDRSSGVEGVAVLDATTRHVSRYLREVPFSSIDDPTRLRRVLEAVLLLEADLDLHSLLRHIVEEARSMTGAQYAALGVLNAERTSLDDFITLGMDAETEERIGARPKGLGILGLVINDPVPIRIADLGSHPEGFGFPAGHPRMTSFLGVPITMRGEVFGNLYLTDKVGWSEFTRDDEAIVVALSVAAGIAIENAHLHQRVQHLAVYAERDRMATDLHDSVIQRLFAAGLSLQSVATRAEPATAERLGEVVDGLDTVIREIRNTIFDLNSSRPDQDLKTQVLAVVRELDDVLGFQVALSFDGPVESALDAAQADSLLMVLREGLTNAARHSGATSISVRLADRGGLVTLTIIDNGRGMTAHDAAPGTGMGLANMRSRAERLGGTMKIAFGEFGGLSLTWSIPTTR